MDEPATATLTAMGQNTIFKTAVLSRGEVQLNAVQLGRGLRTPNKVSELTRIILFGPL